MATVTHPDLVGGPSGRYLWQSDTKGALGGPTILYLPEIPFFEPVGDGITEARSADMALSGQSAEIRACVSAIRRVGRAGAPLLQAAGDMFALHRKWSDKSIKE